MERLAEALSAMQSNLNNTFVQKAAAATLIGSAVSWLLWRNRGGQKRMSEKDFDDAVDLAADAFVDSPSYAWFGGERAWRKEQLKWLFGINVRENKGADCRLFRDEQGTAVCFFLLQRPRGMLSGLSETWLLVRFLSRYGLEPFRRVGKIVSKIDEIKHAALVSAGADESNCLTLGRMVVHPSQQGKGRGSKHLGAALAAEAHSTPVILMTQKESNVRFYSKLGFRVMSNQHIEGLGQNWAMLRLPPS